MVASLALKRPSRYLTCPSRGCLIASVATRPAGRLSLEDTWALPLTEVSGLARLELPSNEGTRLVAISDEDFGVVAVEVDEEGRPGEAKLRPLWRRLPDEVRCAEEGSEYEGVACDGEGALFVMQEGPARVLAFAPGFGELRQTIHLRVDPDEPGFGRQWSDEQEASNSRGEALLLLRDGHLLVLKQRDPRRFIEFGPPSADAIGLRPEAYLEPGQPFELQPGPHADLDVLASWPLHPDAKARFKSLNDVAVGDDGRLYVISSGSRRIGRVEAQVEAGEDSVRISEEWDLPEDLPGGEDGKPEGLALLDGLRPLVSVDTKVCGDNLARLERLPG
jgi:hypothetical protein